MERDMLLKGKNSGATGGIYAFFARKRTQRMVRFYSYGSRFVSALGLAVHRVVVDMFFLHSSLSVLKLGF